MWAWGRGIEILNSIEKRNSVDLNVWLWRKDDESTRRHIPEDCFLHSHRRENVKSSISSLYRTFPIESTAVSDSADVALQMGYIPSVTTCRCSGGTSNQATNSPFHILPVHYSRMLLRFDRAVNKSVNWTMETCMVKWNWSWHNYSGETQVNWSFEIEWMNSFCLIQGHRVLNCEPRNDAVTSEASPLFIGTSPNFQWRSGKETASLYVGYNWFYLFNI
jgi:hypothetical protein